MNTTVFGSKTKSRRVAVKAAHLIRESDLDPNETDESDSHSEKHDGLTNNPRKDREEAAEIGRLVPIRGSNEGLDVEHGKATGTAATSLSSRAYLFA
jgi:hypothetical protein